MRRDEARSILRSYDSNGSGAADPQVREALQVLRHDPELSHRFALEQSVDKALAQKFQAFPVPADLKDRLLAARKTVPRRTWWQRPALLGVMAASLMLLGALAFILSRASEQSPFSAYHSYIVEAAATLDHLDIQTSDLTQIRAWLGGHQAPADFTIPGSLNGKARVGCRVFEWNGHRVSLICFEIEDKKVAHLFVLDESFLSTPPTEPVPQFSTSPEGMATASWSDGQRTYVLALRHGEQELKRVLL